MLRRTNDKYYGVMNDWDLATVVGESPDTKRGVLTGTVPFMAQDELFKLAVKQSDKRIYRYDLEAFVWILLWVCVRYQDTRLLPNPELSHWKSFDFGGIASSKQAYIDHEWRERHAVRPTKSWENEWRLTPHIFEWCRSRPQMNSSASYDLLRRLFAWDPDEQITAKEALLHK